MARKANLPSFTTLSNKKSVESASDKKLYGDKSCQVVRCYKKNNPVFGDKICQSNLCSDKNCQDTKFKQPVKPAMDMWSREPSMWSSFNKKHIALCNDKSCQSTTCYKKENPVKQGSMCSDKNCQETNLFIYGHWSQKRKSQILCSYPNQQWNNLIQRTRTLNLLAVSRKSVQLDQCAMTRTVNLPNICVVIRSVT